MTPRPLRLTSVDSCASTQPLASDALDADPGGVHVVRAHEQVAGLGRGGRSWSTPPGDSLMLSVALVPRVAASELDGIVRRVVDVVHGHVARHAGIDVARVAWSPPNDLVDAASGAKLAGVLVDASIVADAATRVVIGIGVNVAGATFTLADGRRCATLESIAGRTVAHDAAALDQLARRVAVDVAALLDVRVSR